MIRRPLFAFLVLLLAACKPAPDEAARTPPPERSAPGPGGAPPKATASPTLAAVKARGHLNCGVNPGLAGFAYQDERGRWQGFDADFCRALAAAVLGKPDAVDFVPLSNAERIAALKAGKVDVLSRNTSWTFSRDAGQGVDFAGVSYYDGQGFLARKALNLQSAAELKGARICVQSGATSQPNIDDYFRARGVQYTAIVFPSADDARAAYEKEGCDALTADVSALAAARSLMANPAEHEILPDVISKEPQGPVVRQDDTGWTDIVRWTLNALILAEEHGVTAKTAQAMREGADGEMRRLLGGEPGYGALLGLSDAWAFNAIRQVGNYGEIFDRNLGQTSALRLRRGQNALWNANPPGLHYAPPFR